MRVIIDEDAYADIERIAVWVAKDNLNAARSIVEKIMLSIERLAVFPAMGRIGRVKGTLERVVSGVPYLIVYQIMQKPNAVVVTAVFHSAQDR